MTSQFRLTVDLHVMALLLGGLACATDDSQPGPPGSEQGFVEPRDARGGNADPDSPSGAAPAAGAPEPADTSSPPGGSSAGDTSGSEPGAEGGPSVSGPVASGTGEMAGGSAGANTDSQEGGVP
jgi:hypothetical protein